MPTNPRQGDADAGGRVSSRAGNPHALRRRSEGESGARGGRGEEVRASAPCADAARRRAKRSGAPERCAAKGAPARATSPRPPLDPLTPSLRRLSAEGVLPDSHTRPASPSIRTSSFVLRPQMEKRARLEIAEHRRSGSEAFLPALGVQEKEHWPSSAAPWRGGRFGRRVWDLPCGRGEAARAPLLLCFQARLLSATHLGRHSSLRE